MQTPNQIILQGNMKDILYVYNLHMNQFTNLQSILNFELIPIIYNYHNLPVVRVKLLCSLPTEIQTQSFLMDGRWNYNERSTTLDDHWASEGQAWAQQMLSLVLFCLRTNTDTQLIQKPYLFACKSKFVVRRTWGLTWMYSTMKTKVLGGLNVGGHWSKFLGANVWLKILYL